MKKDFAEIEREAELADLGRKKAVEEEKVVEKNKEEDEAKAAASMRLAYQDLSIEQKKTEEKIRTVDPKKANQVSIACSQCFNVSCMFYRESNGDPLSAYFGLPNKRRGWEFSQ